MRREMPMSSQQLSFLVFLMIPGSALVYITGSAAGPSAWLAGLLGLIVGLVLLYIVVKLHDWYPGQRLSAISTTLLGKVPGTLLNLLFLWSVFLTSCHLIYNISILIKVIYPVIPRTIIYPIIVLTCMYCLYKGLTVLGRMGELFFWMSFLFLLMGLGLLLPLVDLSRLRPVFTDWRPLLLGSLYALDWPFAQIVIIGLFIPLVSDLDQKKKRLYQWYFIAGAVFVCFDFAVVGTIGPRLSDLFQFPLFEVFRLAGFGEFKRVEVGFLLLWFIMGITAINIFFQGLAFMVQDILRLSDYKPLLLPLGLCLVVFTTYIFPSDVLHHLLAFKYMPVYTLPVNLLYLLVLFTAALINRPRTARNQMKKSA